MPAGATSYQVNDRLWVGIQTGAPFGLVTKPRDTWAGELYGRSNRIFTLAFNPVIGFKVNEWLSIAAGPNIEYFKLTLKQAQITGVPFNPANLSSSILKAIPGASASPRACWSPPGPGLRSASAIAPRCITTSMARSGCPAPPPSSAGRSWPT